MMNFLEGSRIGLSLSSGMKTEPHDCGDDNEEQPNRCDSPVLEDNSCILDEYSYFSERLDFSKS